jgi:hypothetical protein
MDSYCLDTWVIFDQIVRVFDGPWDVLMLLCRASYIAATNYAKEPQHNHALTVAGSSAAPIINIPRGQFGIYIDVDEIRNHPTTTVKIRTMSYGRVTKLEKIEMPGNTMTRKDNVYSGNWYTLYKYRIYKHIIEVKGKCTIRKVYVGYYMECLLEPETLAQLTRERYDEITSDYYGAPFVIHVTACVIGRKDTTYVIIIDTNTKTHRSSQIEQIVEETIRAHPMYSKFFAQ